MRALSLFTGCGLLDYGLHLAGIRTVAVCEADEWRRERILAQRFPDAVRHADVRELDGREYRGRVDLVAGGFPCRGASTAGKREGFGHPETALWSEFARIVADSAPRYVLVENVAAILTLHDGSVWGTVLGDLAALGFGLWWDCLPAAAFGAPHRRDRVFLVAYASDSGRRPDEPDLRPWESDAGGRLVADAGREREQLGGGPGRVGVAAGASRGAGDQRQRDGHAAGDRSATTADADGGRLAQQPQRDSQQRNGQHRQPGADPERRGIRVEWGDYRPAIERWERTLGRPAPPPLTTVRRVADGRPGRLDRHRLSALGDGVLVQCGWLVGRMIVEHALETAS